MTFNGYNAQSIPTVPSMDALPIHADPYYYNYEYPNMCNAGYNNGVAMRSEKQKLFLHVTTREDAMQFGTVVHKDWNSIFIPSVHHTFMNETTLRHLIEDVFCIGMVRRIDYIDKPEEHKRMAFVHFEYWHNNDNAIFLRKVIEEMETVDIYGCMDNHNGFYDLAQLIHYYPYDDSRPYFIRFMMNKTPIVETELNIHQLADITMRLENIIKEQTDTIEKLTKLVETQKNNIDVLERENVTKNYALDALMDRITKLEERMQRMEVRDHYVSSNTPTIIYGSEMNDSDIETTYENDDEADAISHCATNGNNLLNNNEDYSDMNSYDDDEDNKSEEYGNTEENDIYERLPIMEYPEPEIEQYTEYLDFETNTSNNGPLTMSDLYVETEMQRDLRVSRRFTHYNIIEYDSDYETEQDFSEEYINDAMDICE